MDQDHEITLRKLIVDDVGDFVAWATDAKRRDGVRAGGSIWGKGIVTKAMKIAVKMVFGEREELERVETFGDMENRWSQRVLKKNGVLRKYQKTWMTLRITKI
ncbi:GNAT domain [Dillenia turbinata]|uniref:GNAT domain n=1 Tax=Dillenia turbinata TaxID=194707 RepID=A0AAN8VLW2_9MAGN